MPYEALIFDLDNTLYPAESGLCDRIVGRIVRGLSARTGLTEDEAVRRIEEWWPRYPIPFAMALHYPDIPTREFVEDYYRIGRPYLPRDPDLGRALAKAKIPKFILSDGIRSHVKRVTGWLGIRDCFDGVHALDDHEDLGYVQKTHPDVMPRAFAEFGIRDPSSCLMFEDGADALKLFKERYGGATCLITPNPDNRPDFCDFAATSIVPAIRYICRKTAKHQAEFKQPSSPHFFHSRIRSSGSV